jgi:hypothetical protein
MALPHMLPFGALLTLTWRRCLADGQEMRPKGLVVPAAPPALGAPTADAAAEAVDVGVQAPAAQKEVLPADIEALAVALDHLAQCDGPGLEAARVSTLVAESQVAAHTACRAACEACVLVHQFYRNLSEHNKTLGPLAGKFDDTERRRRRQIISKALPVLRDFLVVRAASIHATTDKAVITKSLTDMLGGDPEDRFAKDLVSKLLNAHRHVLTELPAAPDPQQKQGAQQPQEVRKAGLQAAAASSSSSSSTPGLEASTLAEEPAAEEPTAEDTRGDDELHPGDRQHLPHQVSLNPPRGLAPGPARTCPPPPPVWQSCVFVSPHFGPLDGPSCASVFCSGGPLCGCGQCG